MSQPATSSGSIAVTVGAQVVPSASATSQLMSGYLTSVVCTGGSAAGTVSVYDGTSTAGLLLCTLAGVPIGTTEVFNISEGVVFSRGLFIVVSGTGSSAVLHYVVA